MTCPPEVIQKAGIAFTCTATVNGRQYPFAVTEVESPESDHARSLAWLLHKAGMNRASLGSARETRAKWQCRNSKEALR